MQAERLGTQITLTENEQEKLDLAYGVIGDILSIIEENIYFENLTISSNGIDYNYDDILTVANILDCFMNDTILIKGD